MTTTKLYTAEEAAELPENDYHEELVRGLLIRDPLAGYMHGRRAATITFLLNTHLDVARIGGEIVVEAGFVLQRDPDTVRIPDVAFVAAERTRAPDDTRPFFEGAPDLAVEVISPQRRLSTARKKVPEYFAAGGRLVWIVEERSRSVTVHRPDGTAQTYGYDDTLTGEDVLPGLELPVRKIFD